MTSAPASGDMSAFGGTRAPNLQIRSDLQSRPLPAHSGADLLKYLSTMRSERQP